MREPSVAPSRLRLRTYLTAWYALFIVYGSLSPFTGWKDQGLVFLSVLTAPLGETYSWFDTVVNLLAYFPFGLLLGLTLRARLGPGWSLLLATLGGVALSATMEYVQMYLPGRVSSNLDLLNNGISTLAGALLAISIAPRAWFALHLTRWRIRFFHPHADRDLGLALVSLWMFAQINPSLPMLGNVFISEVARPLFEAAHDEPFSFLESMAVALNLLMLGMLLLTLLRKRNHAVSVLLVVISLVALVKFVAAAVLLKSWALLLWLNSEAILGIVIGALLLLAASWLPRARLVQVAMLTSLTYLVLTHWLLDGGAPSSAMRLYQWHYGHLLNYNGLSQTVALVFPFLLLGYLWRLRNQYDEVV
ncbi:MAG: VanZ family protein [Nitrosomonadales bacterium]